MEEQQLGALLDRFSFGYWRIFQNFVLGIFFFAVGAAFIGLIVAGYVIEGIPDDVFVLLVVTPLLLILGGFGLLLGGVQLYSVIVMIFGRMSFSIYENGMLVEKRSSAQLYLWRDFVSIDFALIGYFSWISFGMGWVLETDDGRQVEIEPVFPGFDQLGEYIRRRIGSILILRVVNQLKSGELVTFGDVEIDRTGMWIKEDYIAWSDILPEQLKITSAISSYTFQITRKSDQKNFSVDVMRTPQGHVLMWTINYVLENHEIFVT